MQSEYNSQILDKEIKTVLSKVNAIIQKNGSSQLFHRVFLRPIDIALKDWQT